MFTIAVSAHLLGTIVLAIFFVLLERHDRRAYLRDWMAAWIAQGLALATLLLVAPRDFSLGFGLYLFLETAHGALLLLAAVGYARREVRGRVRLWLVLPAIAWAAAAPAVFREEWALHAAQYVALGATALGAAYVMWPQRIRAGMGVRLTTNVFLLLGALHLVHAVVFARSARTGTSLHPLFEVLPFEVLLLQTMLGFGMVLTVMEAAQFLVIAANAELEQARRRLEVLAETDPLTGCFNRRVFRELVDHLRAGGGHQHGVIVMIDMDGLKAINDIQGHAAGDAAIREVAEAIRTRTRTTDVVVRWGGDEFVVVLPGASAEDGALRRDEIMAAIAHAGRAASAGLARYGDGVDVMAAVEEADQRMYVTKGERRRAASA
ncbi:MAG TPA: GGDEF domain-containing protein [Vicinamibacteria bacterium]|nr:GGDEF domain-containing protein [Vicinamibacteria bacterium]